jgi:hypothetical protein
MNIYHNTTDEQNTGQEERKKREKRTGNKQATVEGVLEK